MRADRRSVGMVLGGLVVVLFVTLGFAATPLYFIVAAMFGLALIIQKIRS